MIKLDSSTMKIVCSISMGIGMAMLVMRADLMNIILGAMIVLGVLYNKYDKSGI